MQGLTEEERKLIQKRIKSIRTRLYPYVPPRPKRKPEMIDYGITDNIIKQNILRKEQQESNRKELFLIIQIGIVLFILISEKFDAFSIFGAVIFIMCSQFYRDLFCRAKTTEIDNKIREYETALEHWKWWTELYPKKKVAVYWFSLNGYEFEKSLAEVFAANGFEAYLTSKSNDGGVDIILKNKENDEIYVQCKAFHGKAGVAIVRELYGVMQSNGISQGIIACLGGFTSGAQDFAKDKNIKLLSIDEIIKMIS